MLSEKDSHAPFVVIPAIDVLGGEAVRLRQGSFEHVVAQGGDPLALARRFASAGAPVIHVVDLDGARSGRLRTELVAALAAAAAPSAIQASGGIRSPADAKRVLEAGAQRVVVGTAAFGRRGALAAFVQALGERLIVALDAREGRIAAAGWTRDSGLPVEEAAERCATAGVARLLCTAIERDGTLGGPDLALLAHVRARSGLPVLAAGGVASAGDLDEIAASGCEGAIVGRALLDGSLSLESLWQSA